MANLTLSVGLVNVPVAINPLARDTSIRGRMMCPDHLVPLKAGPMRCEHNHEVEREKIVTGYEVEGGFVEVDAKALASDRTQSVDLEMSVDVADIDPIYFEKTYYVAPRDGGQAGYDLLTQVLRDDGRALVGKAVFSKTTRPLVIRWSEATNCLVAHQCTFDAKVQWHQVKLVAAGVKERGAPSKAHLTAARQLLDTLEGDFMPEEFVDEYKQRLQEAVDAAAEGRELQPVAEKKAKPTRDLLADLKASLGEAKPKPKPKRKPAARKPRASKAA